MNNVSIVEARSRMADIINGVAYGGERVVLERHGKGVVAIVSVEDLELLEAIEDQEDVKAARRALSEMKRKGVKPVSWDKVKAMAGR
ncbi:MAG: type II toxin-antitoxin system Phd/YefM family antitoxin [Phycisphaeraceae bacterium]|nr:type II toxin-antitoxin system Phd/YefM family antitoxin [Phycisphaeraceae bacterium]